MICQRSTIKRDWKYLKRVKSRINSRRKSSEVVRALIMNGRRKTSKESVGRDRDKEPENHQE